MADDEIGSKGGPESGIEHAATYDRFMGALKWGVVAIAVLLILMALFLVE